MQVEVDQSGKVEQTNKVTVLAFANGVEWSILISASQKRKVLAVLKERRPQWSTRLTIVYVFSVLVYLLVKDHIEVIEPYRKLYRHKLLLRYLWTVSSTAICTR